MTSQFEIWIDGKKHNTDEAKVSVLDRGFLYGDSVFETLRTYGGRLFALDEHLERLASSAERVFITLPRSLPELAAHLRQTVEQCPFPECYVRVMITRGQAALGLDPRAAENPLLVVIVAPLVPPSKQDQENGIRAVTYEAARLGDHTVASGAKVGNYLVAVLGQKKAVEVGAKEALITTPQGEVLEGATSNLFWFEQGVLKTVPVEAGILAGITRAHILRVADNSGIPIQFSVPHLRELYQAQAVFISSSIREILSVVQIDDRVIADGQVQAMVRDLHTALVHSARALSANPMS